MQISSSSLYSSSGTCLAQLSLAPRSCYLIVLALLFSCSPFFSPLLFDSFILHFLSFDLIISRSLSLTRSYHFYRLFFLSSPTNPTSLSSTRLPPGPQRTGLIELDSASHSVPMDSHAPLDAQIPPTPSTYDGPQLHHKYRL